MSASESDDTVTLSRTRPPTRTRTATPPWRSPSRTAAAQHDSPAKRHKSRTHTVALADARPRRLTKTRSRRAPQRVHTATPIVPTELARAARTRTPVRVPLESHSKSTTRTVRAQHGAFVLAGRRASRTATGVNRGRNHTVTHLPPPPTTPPPAGFAAATVENLQQSSDVATAVAGVAAAPAAMSISRGAAALSLVSCNVARAELAGDKLRFPASLLPGVGIGEARGAHHRASVVAFSGLAVAGLLIFVASTSEAFGGGVGGAGSDSGEGAQEGDMELGGRGAVQAAPYFVYAGMSAALGLWAPVAGLLMTSLTPLDVVLAVVPLALVLAAAVFASTRVAASMRSPAGIVFTPSFIVPLEADTAGWSRYVRKALQSSVGRYAMVGHSFWTTPRGFLGQAARHLLSIFGPQIQRFRGAVSATPLLESFDEADAPLPPATNGTAASAVAAADNDDEEAAVARPRAAPDLATRLAPHFLCITWTIGVAVGFSQGIAQGWPESCSVLRGVIAALNVLSALLVLWVRPYVVPMRNHISILLDGCVAISSVLIATDLAGSSDPALRLPLLAEALQVLLPTVGIVAAVLMVSTSVVRAVLLKVGKSVIGSQEDAFTQRKLIPSNVALVDFEAAATPGEDVELGGKLGRTEASVDLNAISDADILSYLVTTPARSERAGHKSHRASSKKHHHRHAADDDDGDLAAGLLDSTPPTRHHRHKRA